MLSAQPTDLIVTQPVSRTICKKDISAQFTVVGNPAYILTYHWYRLTGTNEESIPAALHHTYTADIAGEYFCMVIKSPTEMQRSNTVTLTINDAPRIMGFDIPTVCDNSELRVHADPANIISNGSVITSYEWKLNGAYGTTIQPGTGSTISDFVLSTAVAGQSGSVLTLSLTNGCGTGISEPPKPITVWEPTPKPNPISTDYCQGEKAATLSIREDNEAVWYNAATGGQKIPAPTPITSTPGVKTWWVSQKITYPNNGPTCESERTAVTVEVFRLPDVPSTDYVNNNIEMCLNDLPEITLNAQGTDIQWYDSKGPLPPATAPHINNSEAGTQIYYVTQFDGTCESSKEGGKITVQIRNRSVVDAIVLAYNPELCPNNSTVLNVTSQRPNPTFRWYKNQDKTGLIGPPAAVGPTLTTPVLMHDTVFYVTVQFTSAGECESQYPKAAVVNVRDITLPKITAPPHLVIGTDDGVCYATNVRTGVPFVSDNCTLEKNLLVFTNPVAPVEYLLGDTTLVWWVQDEAGNKDYALQTISVRDREKPRGTCPADIPWDINENENSAVIDYNLSYTDNCSEVEMKLDKGLPSGSVFPLGTTLVRHLVSDKAGNVDTCEFKVIVKHPYRDMNINLRVLPASEICPGQEVVITPVISGGSGRFSYSWNPRRWTDAVMRDYPLTNTTYELTVNDGISPPQTKTVQIAVLQSQPVTLTLEDRPMDEIFEGDEVLVTATSGFSSYKLLLNNQEMQVSGLNNKVGFQAELGTYFVKVFATNESGCVSQDQLEVVVDSRKLPNVFTPNRKSLNNQLFLEFLAKDVQSPEDFELQILSRAGELLYKGNNGWDGYYKGKLMPQGTYLYVVRRKMNNGDYRIFKGVVTLKL